MSIDEFNLASERGTGHLPALSVPAALELDVEVYRADMAGFGLDDEQERVFLTTLWSIMQAVVDLGFSSANICEQIFEGVESASAGAGGAVDSSPSSTAETPIDGRKPRTI